MRERFFGVRQRQEIVQGTPGHAAPAKVFGYQRGFRALDQAGEFREMGAIERIRRAERHADAVKRQRIVGANAVEHRERGPAIDIIVLAVDLEPGYRRALRENLPHMRRAQSDPGACQWLGGPHVMM